MKPGLKRSHAPIFWGLFGAGGMLAALFGPMLVFITGIAAPLGWLPDGAADYDTLRALAQSLIGKAVLFGLIALLLWHAAHRIYHSLHDVGVHGGPLAKACTYGVAALGTLAAAGLLLVVGF
ncbi:MULTISPECIES: fumarate reductase subunit FrdD [Chromobacterium]|uniref:fumarate reductase subunit FrdD n=1 Tax=Chromobacterium TaxID=535 RepID=UPI00188858F4|nr:MULTISPECIES: fumarate reductase subunit FrdD [Chromobacterium]QOZ85771.1 fumarate reductase subunit FrdD [Chromobacterium sp. Rain0013]WON83566.1 fumarate reductase subunit FrdD [Chromobacterium haemolyticum]